MVERKTEDKDPSYRVFPSVQWNNYQVRFEPDTRLIQVHEMVCVHENTYPGSHGPSQRRPGYPPNRCTNYGRYSAVAYWSHELHHICQSIQYQINIGTESLQVYCMQKY